MAEFLGERYVAAHQQVGDFEVIQTADGLQKNGGNVASYFCTPEGRVIHAVVGPVPASVLLSEARWAAERFATVADASLPTQKAYLSASHREALMNSANGSTSGRSRRVHELLAEKPLWPLSSLYAQVFEDILGQRVSRAGPNLVLCRRGLELAQRSGQPVLLVLHGSHANEDVRDEWYELLARHSRYHGDPFLPLLRSYVVILLPLREMPALSQQLELPPYISPDQDLPLFVIATSDGRQLDVFTGWDADWQLVPAMARGLVTAVKERPPSVTQLRRIVRLAEQIDKHVAADVRDLLRAQLEVRHAATVRPSANAGKTAASKSPQPVELFDRASGQIAWCELLQQEQFATCRGRLDRLFADRPQGGTEADSRDDVAIAAATRQMKELLRAGVRSSSPSQYVQALRLIDRLESQVRQTHPALLDDKPLGQN